MSQNGPRNFQSKNQLTLNTASKVLSELSKQEDEMNCDIDNGDDLVLEDDDSPVKIHITDQAGILKKKKLEIMNSSDSPKQE